MNLKPTSISMLCIVAALAATSTTAFGKARFGTICQQSFENSWQKKLPESWDRCAWFNDELDDTDTKVFYISMHGAQSLFTDARDQDYLENVDLVFINTHSGAFLGRETKTGWHDAVGSYVMWDKGKRGWTNDLYLGNEKTGLSIMANYTCELLKKDGHVWTRWSRAFKGGLRIVLGSHDNLYHSTTTDECGEDFADNLQDRDKIKYAWKDALSDWNHDQDVAVMASGNSKADCWDRQGGMKWQNFSSSYDRRRGSQMKYLCRTRWDNI